MQTFHNPVATIYIVNPNQHDELKDELSRYAGINRSMGAQIVSALESGKPTVLSDDKNIYNVESHQVCIFSKQSNKPKIFIYHGS